jgi:hypothetical protein
MPLPACNLRLVGFGGRRKTSLGGGINLSGLDIERYVDPDRPATAAKSQMDGLFQVKSNGGGVFDGDRVLGDRMDDGDNIDLLHAQDADAGIALQIGPFDLP